MARNRLARTLKLISEDIAFRRAFEERKPGLINDICLMASPPVGCVIRYRLQCLFYSIGLAPFGWLLKSVNLLLYGIDLDERARVGGGFVIGHPIAISIAGDVTIGERCVVYHHTTIGRSPFFEVGREPGPLVIGNDVVFAMGACAYGNIVIGDGCSVGANSVADRSFPPGVSLLGVPGRIVRPRSGD